MMDLIRLRLRWRHATLCATVWGRVGGKRGIYVRSVGRGSVCLTDPPSLAGRQGDGVGHWSVDFVRSQTETYSKTFTFRWAAYIHCVDCDCVEYEGSVGGGRARVGLNGCGVVWCGIIA